MPVLYSYLQCFLCSYKFLYGPYLLNWVWAAVQADAPPSSQLAATGLAKRGSDYAWKLSENTLWRDLVIMDFLLTK